MSSSSAPSSPTSPAGTNSSLDVIGIDLGATHCRLTHLAPNKHMPTILRNTLGNENTPATVCFLSGQQRLAGEEALGKEMSKPKNTVTQLKQTMVQFDASPSSSALAAATAKKDDTGALVFEFADDGSEDYPIDAQFPWTQRVEQVLGFQLKQLLKNAPPKQQQQQDSTTTIAAEPRYIAVSVPASASEKFYRSTLRSAAKIAGVADVENKLILVDETKAAALYLHHLQFKQLPTEAEIADKKKEPTRLAVVSIGEVSSFAMLVEATQSSVSILAENSESNLGTRDIDAAIVNWAVGEIKKKSGGVDVSDHLKSMNKVRRDCSKAKVMLSTTDKTVLAFESLKDGIDVNVPLSKTEMEQLAAPVLERFRKLCTFSATDAPSRVEVIGNGWRAPCIQNVIKSCFQLASDANLGMSLDANTAVAEGASIAAMVQVLAAADASQQEGVAASHSVKFSTAAPRDDHQNEEQSQTATATSLVDSWISQEESMTARDQFYITRLSAKNDLEKAVLSCMEIIDDIKFSADRSAKRDELQSVLRAADDWLRDFEAASTEEFIAEKKKLDEKIAADFPEVEAHYEMLREEQRQKDEELAKLAATREENKELKSDPQRLRVAGERREQGANLFKQEHWEEAQTRFVQAVAILQDIYDLKSEEITTERNKILLSCYLNIASCGIKLQRWRNAANNAAKALDIDPNNAKAYFRRGQANSQLGEFDAARQDLEKSLQLSGGDAAVKAELDALSKKVEAQKQKEKKMFSKMFG